MHVYYIYVIESYIFKVNCTYRILKASIREEGKAEFCFSIFFNVSPMTLGDICFQKNWKEKDVKESCKL